MWQYGYRANQIIIISIVITNVDANIGGLFLRYPFTRNVYFIADNFPVSPLTFDLIS